MYVCECLYACVCVCVCVSENLKMKEKILKSDLKKAKVYDFAFFNHFAGKIH